MARDTSAFTRLSVHPVAGALGAEIRGLDLSKPLDDTAFAELRQAWLQYHVVFLRDQKMAPGNMEVKLFLRELIKIF